MTPDPRGEDAIDTLLILTYLLMATVMWSSNTGHWLYYVIEILSFVLNILCYSYILFPYKPIDCCQVCYHVSLHDI